MSNHKFHEFFAGSGLVSCGLSGSFDSIWANDISERKARVYEANFGLNNFHLGDIGLVHGEDLPDAHLSWASFPCQDLSLAGNIDGIHSRRSGLVWEWIRIIDELGDRAPRVFCLENVSGLVSAHGGSDYMQLHNALSERGYQVGAALINANAFVPQSRPRVFVVGVRGEIPKDLISSGPTWAHPRSVVRAASLVRDFVWWDLGELPHRTCGLSDVVEREMLFDRDDVINLVPKNHLDKAMASGLRYVTGYRRTRNGKQVLELRCDGIAGCLRTPAGGSSRQYLLSLAKGGLHARLLSVREVARLMGAPDSFVLPGTYNDGYFAMGDAVAVPVAKHIAGTILKPLVESAYEQM